MSDARDLGAMQRFLLEWGAWEQCVCAKSCLTLCDPMDCSPPGSSVQGILQARILEWVATPSSRGSSRPRDQTWVSLCPLHWQVGSSPLVPPEKPLGTVTWHKPPANSGLHVEGLVSSGG